MKSSEQDLDISENKITFENILSSGDSSVRLIKRTEFESLLIFATKCIARYFRLCYPNQIEIAPIIAGDLINIKEHWKAADFVNLARFLRQRQDVKDIRVVGNTMTIPKFLEMVCSYEDHRAQEQERLHTESKQLDHSERVHRTTTLEKIMIKNINKKPEIGGRSDEKADFNRLSFYQDNQSPSHNT